jgi:hypothetical protein
MINAIRLPLSFVLYLIYRVNRWRLANRVLMKHGPLAYEYYIHTTAGSFAEFRGLNG